MQSVTGSHELHRQCRNFRKLLCASWITLALNLRISVVPYLHTQDVFRKQVPDDRVKWGVEWDDYRPKDYTSPQLKGKPYADGQNPRQCKFHALDKGGVNRVSYTAWVLYYSLFPHLRPLVPWHVSESTISTPPVDVR